MPSTFATDLIDLLPRCRRFALSLTGKADEADDLVQAACERALKARDQWQEGTRLDAWLFRIIRNLWIDAIRKRRLQGPADDIDAAIDLSGDDGVAVTEAALMMSAVEDGINRLPRDQREVLVLVCIEEASYRDAAQALGVPIGTVMSRLARARRTLAATLGLEPGDRVLSRPG